MGAQQHPLLWRWPQFCHHIRSKCWRSQCWISNVVTLFERWYPFESPVFFFFCEIIFWYWWLGLFHRAIAQSGSSMCPWSLMTNVGNYTKQLAKGLNCPTKPSYKMLRCLRSKNAREILNYRKKMKVIIGERYFIFSVMSQTLNFNLEISSSNFCFNLCLLKTKGI